MTNQAENYEEKRKFKRVSVNADAEFEFFQAVSQASMLNKQNQKMNAKVDNISLGGLQIITDFEIPCEQILRMRVCFGNTGFKIGAYSQVRWSRFDEKLKKYRVGLQFFYLKEQHRVICSKLIESNSN